MKFKFTDRMIENIVTLSLSGGVIAVVWALVHNWSQFSGFFGKIVTSMIPFLLGLFIAFVLLPLRRRVERVWLAKTGLSDGVKRKLAVLITMLIFAIVIASFFIVLIPQLMSSLGMLLNSMEGYMRTVDSWLSNLGDTQYAEIIDSIYQNLRTNITQLIRNAATMVPRIVSYSVSFISRIFDFFIGVIIALYILLDEEKFTLQVKRVVYATHSPQGVERLGRIARLTSTMFNSFIFGKALDSLIIGVICWFVTTLMNIPYAPLISFIVGLTNMIPVFGPFIGAIPSIFILLIINPAKALEFTIFVVILQQVDGNIIGPRILGDSLGLPALWIMFAISVGGAMFGIIGMFLGVPIFSVIYYLIRDAIYTRLAEKNIKIK